MSLPKITVVTPSFRQAHYLEACFKSVIAQDYPNLEWFVVDGGSIDGSVDLIRKYEKHFAWWVSEKDRNHPHALNKGYERATGDIFCFINSDDVLEPGTLHYVAKQFQQPGTTWVVGWAKYFNDDGDDWVYMPKSCERDTDWFRHNPIPQQSSFWLREAFNKVGPFTEKYLWAFDYEYWMRLRFKGGYKPKVVRRCLGSFRLQPDSKTCSKPENYAPDYAGIFQEYSVYLTPDQIRYVQNAKRQRENGKKQRRAWDALNERDLTTARRLAREALRDRFSIDNWKLMLCALRGY